MAFLRLALSLAALLLVVVPSLARADEPPVHGHGIFWRVERDGVAPSYVFGTMHSSDPRALALIGDVEGALRQAEVAVFETLPGVEDWDAASAAFRRFALLPDGRRLDEILEPDLLEKVLARTERNGYDRDFVRRLRPWLIGIMLSPSFEADSGNERSLSLDDALIALSKTEGKPLYAVERLDELLRLYDDMPWDIQIALLRQRVAKEADSDRSGAAAGNELLCLYMAEDIAAIFSYDLAAPERSSVLEAAADEFDIFRRNELWIERLLPYLDAGGAFVAVGAGHLPGERGLLRLIERAGYTLTRLPLDAPSC